jgi:hypothetical protein
MRTKTLALPKGTLPALARTEIVVAPIEFDGVKRVQIAVRQFDTFGLPYVTQTITAEISEARDLAARLLKAAGD